MSLEILITTVETETKEPKEVILDCLTHIVEKFGTNPFDDDDILDTISTIGILLCEKLHSENYLNIVFKYACNINRGEEETNNLSNNCMFCNQTLHEKIDDHEINRVYNFTRKNYETIISYLASENEKKYFMNELIKNFENLGKEKNAIIPFLGAGVSTPFSLPSWEKLLRELEEFLSKEFQKEAYSEFIDEGDFFGGLDYLMDKSLYISNEDQLKDEIIKIITKANLGIDESEHNFYDFVDLKADYYITTNYDLLMECFLTDAGDYNTPICMDEIGNLRNMSTSGNSIIHLHGHINRKSSMIVTKKDYTKLYSKKGTLVQLSAIVGSRPLLFIGYSFKDKFFVQMYEKLIEILQTDHYLVLFNPDTKEIKELNKKNIKVIGLSVTDGNYAKAIKVLINYIKRKGL